MRNYLLNLLNDLNPGVDYETCTSLVTDHYLNSLTLVALIPEIEDEFDIEIPAVEIVTSNFDSVDAMANLVGRLLEEGLD